MRKKQTQATKSNSYSKEDYEQLGKLLKNIYETGYPSNKKFFVMNFVRGIVAGLGSVIGATIVVALLLWILSLFDSLPLIESIVNKIEPSN